MYVYSVFAQFSSHVVLHVPESKVSTQLMYSVLERKKSGFRAIIMQFILAHWGTWIYKVRNNFQCV